MLSTFASRAALLLAAGFALSGEAAAQSYLPVGPQENVTEATVLAGGWTVCHSSLYGESGTSVASILAACSEENIMYACRPVGQASFDVLAQAPRADVFFDTGTGNVPHNANGTAWYFNDSYSFGFAPVGEPISRNSCDTHPTLINQRMCVHTGGGVTSTGWSCGNHQWEYGNGWERVILQSVPTVSLTVPGSNSPRLIA
ncbi:hypothetical protein, partial [Arenimonas malthae]|uniref:hypothetical protein n=1 Tax=Arenimonas malthae TaxID=354197 RepID=UPI0005C1B797